MTTAMLEKRVRALEEEIKELKQAVKKQPRFPVFTHKNVKAKKLPKGVLAGLRDLKDGRIVGSFSSGEAMRRAFEKK